MNCVTEELPRCRLSCCHFCSAVGFVLVSFPTVGCLVAGCPLSVVLLSVFLLSIVLLVVLLSCCRLHYCRRFVGFLLPVVLRSAALVSVVNCTVGCPVSVPYCWLSCCRLSCCRLSCYRLSCCHVCASLKYPWGEQWRKQEVVKGEQLGFGKGKFQGDQAPSIVLMGTVTKLSIQYNGIWYSTIQNNGISYNVGLIK